VAAALLSGLLIGSTLAILVLISFETCTAPAAEAVRE
jgi:hypothetical protein